MSSAQFLELNDVNEAPENKRDKKRRDLVEKLNKQSAEIYDRRDLIFLEAHNAMTDVHNHLLSTSPTNPYEFTAAPSTGSLMTSREQNLRLYELSLERDAILSAIKHTYGYAMDSAKSLYEIERSRVEEEYDSVQRSIKTKLIDAIEEKKRKLKEEKDMEVGVESLLDATNFSRSTRTSRNRKSGNVSSSVGGTPSQQDPNESEATVPSSSYLGVAFEDILGSSSLNSVLGGKKKKTPAGPPGMTGPFLGLGRSINSGLTAAKDIDVDTDMMEIRKKRRRK
ncbi:hypothetical protein E3Q22_01814 [Wallemia mellicola]|uniref:Uncharacterized protein n=2 Tax=Wallemia mellicola TaxID=1708541 RepID=A0A4T0N098_9BASI|nr:hypothetical protein WALSEDRAFT_69481 [Wallemia mellicola CBS 633.66]TIB73750.1 hypothetical protein E3Q24_00892 [Wallemia mellicola]EIM20796.1 hypothetical protein WALSEDRAFT_69481 [Wallemia mellicola CBS 633.66]TIB77218.1 hypothetical protein E3Q23_01401 [Wallemia mellicola]TIB80558.1 hypothetical protein E3Q22_01814 [Wallemia mellicola]TIB86668.1 hypothetical protein E3Q21_01576 [Wallemia mellicola]|eukprot:XP_006959061.1 hypothetical protein WALSEDRAFT_69481 [Wallemia mellicola CBS 633.66]